MFKSKTKSLQDRRKAEYAASGLSRDRIGSMCATIKQLQLTDPQKNWIENVVIEEMYSMIDLSVTNRKKALTLLFTFRALPILTSLLTALAAQVPNIQQASLFAVNFFTVISALANESNRLNKFYANWVFARATVNDLYAATIKFLAVPDHQMAFIKYVREIDRLQRRYDNTINDLLSADLETAPQDKDKVPNRPTNPGETMAARTTIAAPHATQRVMAEKPLDAQEPVSDEYDPVAELDAKETPQDKPQSDKSAEVNIGPDF